MRHFPKWWEWPCIRIGHLLPHSASKLVVFRRNGTSFGDMHRMQGLFWLFHCEDVECLALLAALPTVSRSEEDSNVLTLFENSQHHQPK